jgi:hypothetical protein
MYTRKKFFKKTAAAIASIIGISAVGSSCSSPAEKEVPEAEEKPVKDCNDLSGVSEQELKKRTQFGYEAESSAPERNCGSCALYVLPKQGVGCGGCMLFQGPVNPAGSCIQFAAKT